MLCFNEYRVIIFDCDGVILDSNNMKIKAMYSALKTSLYPAELIDVAVNTFLNNFGKSRQYHCHYFVETLLGLHGKKSTDLQQLILSNYSQAVEDEYLTVPMTEGSAALLNSLKHKHLYIGSGSEEEQLVRILKKREISHYFNGIFGSPEKKSINIKNILGNHPNEKIIFIGDALADYNAAVDNNIDFIFYAPYSNVKIKMLEMSKTHHFHVIHSFLDNINYGCSK